MTEILIIEDEAAIRNNLVRFLKLEGYIVHIAADGLEGLNKARELQPDLILCDVMMPGLDGFGVLQALKADPGTVHLRFVFLSASAEKEQLQHGLTLGALGYVTKPFVLPELAAFIKHHLTEAEGDQP